MGEGYAAIQRGGGLPVVGGGGSLMTHSAGSVTQSIALKYVMASEPYRYTWYLKQVMAGMPYIKIYSFSLIHNKILGRYAKIWIFHENNILQNYFSKWVHGYLTTRCVK